MARTIGIDLGTTNSCVCYLEQQEVRTVPNPEGARVIPSMVALNTDGETIYGHVAKRQFVTNSAKTLWGIKRLIGMKFETPQVQEIHRRVGFGIKASENGDCLVQLGERWCPPEEISGLFLAHLKQVADAYLGESVQNCVITVPAFFNDAQRQATRNAGELAGLKVLRIINEPTAALLAYGHKGRKDGMYAVYDLGGGTFDISIIEVSGDVYRVVSSLGDTFLGGGDFDAAVVEWMLETIRADIRTDPTADRAAMQRIIQAAEQVKIELSFAQEAQINIPYLLYDGTGNPYHLNRKFTRAELEHMTAPLVNRTLELIQQSLSDVGLKPEQIQKTVLVGGQSRMPIIARKLQALFGHEPASDLNPDEVVAQGAALQAEIIKGGYRDLLLLDVTPLSLGVATRGDRFTKVIDRNTTIPTRKTMTFTTISDNQRVVDIEVRQGEREIASENKLLGTFSLVGIPLAPRGIPQIDVTFEIDGDGVVKVSAVDQKTNQSQSIEVQPASGLSPEEIQRIIADGEAHRADDQIFLERQSLLSDIREEAATLSLFSQNHANLLGKTSLQELEAHCQLAVNASQDESLQDLMDLLENLRALRTRVTQVLIDGFPQQEDS